MSTTAHESTRVAAGFHLFVERGELPFTSIHVPPGLNYLRPGELTLTPASPAGCATVRLEGVTVPGGPLGVGEVETLLVAAPRALRARINGMPAPAVALLRIRDQLRIGAGPVLHVSAYRRARIEQVSGDLLGRSCGLCRTDLEPGSTVVVHGCGVAFHLESTEPPAGRPPEETEEPLLCATIAGDCLCGKPVRTEDGWAWHPEDRP